MSDAEGTILRASIRTQHAALVDSHCSGVQQISCLVHEHTDRRLDFCHFCVVVKDGFVADDSRVLPVHPGRDLELGLLDVNLAPEEVSSMVEGGQMGELHFESKGDVVWNRHFCRFESRASVGSDAIVWTSNILKKINMFVKAKSQELTERG